ncbi:MAG: hypothetical protein AVDCRST_MAG89-4108 [uncultured Gemmatimonadetes bacterium]|uniref:Uncharacterized protein n=1 Tax=uncultured Gemmatimonadota bacterium TaxID=203437 RepID=A0A6J4MQV6_9BACT|nr:MAG: hypothetical protein AVDCRST_MAG89-4108 [uncultured Gemmatimonadota bacterium]
MLVLRLVLTRVLLGPVTRLLGRGFPLLLRALRLLRR